MYVVGVDLDGVLVYEFVLLCFGYVGFRDRFVIGYG